MGASFSRDYYEKYKGKDTEVRNCGDHVTPCDISRYIKDKKNKGFTLDEEDRRLLQKAREILSMEADYILCDCAAIVVGKDIDVVFLAGNSPGNIYVFTIPDINKEVESICTNRSFKRISIEFGISAGKIVFGAVAGAVAGVAVGAIVSSVGGPAAALAVGAQAGAATGTVAGMAVEATLKAITYYK